MSAQPLAVLRTGLVTSVGLTAPAACAAIRAGLANPTETRFKDSAGGWLMCHSVALPRPWRGIEKLARMAAMAIEEALVDTPRQEWERIPLLICVAERTRPGREDGIEDELLNRIYALLELSLAPDSLVVPYGRVGAAVALLRARQSVYENKAPAALIVGADSLLSWPTLRELDARRRLLTQANSNGVIAGEGAGAVLVGRPTASPQLLIEGIGFGTEACHIDTDEPLRAEGLTHAIKNALGDARREMHDLDFRITDIGGEQYYFKEAALALSRTLRQRKAEFDIWHPAECVGEAGSAIGPTLLAVADCACRKAYAAGPGILIHLANDAGQRAALVARYGAN